MKIFPAITILGLGILLTACAPGDTPPNAVTSDSPQMRMTTEIPAGISTPDKLDTETLGNLSFFDGVPVP